MIDGVDSILGKRFLARNKNTNVATRTNIISLPDVQQQYHRQICDPSFDDFTILGHGTNKFLLEIKKSLLIKRDKPILIKNISSAPLFLFGKV